MVTQAVTKAELADTLDEVMRLVFAGLSTTIATMKPDGDIDAAIERMSSAVAAIDARIGALRGDEE